MMGALIVSFGLGFVAGLRSMTAPAVVAWASCIGWVNLSDSRLAFMGSRWLVRALHVPDAAIAIPEDGIALGLGLLLTYTLK